jgi:type II secretory pathway pseudopilin PulG
MRSDERGYAMAALLVAMSVMAVVMSMLLPEWRTMAQREKEAELVFRGEQYARAISLFQRRYPGAFPPNLQVLLDQKFLRKQYKDPITNDDFQLIAVGAALPGAPPGANPQQGRGGAQPPQQQPLGRGGAARGTATPTGPGVQTGVQGVVSKSTDESLRVYNGFNHYNEWVFVATAASQAIGAPGTPNPEAGRGTAQPGAGGAPAGRGGQRLGLPPARGRGNQPTGLPQQPGRGRQ